MISTTIKGEYLNEIEAGRKTTEYRAMSNFWKKRIEGKTHRAILFLCGPRVRLYAVEKIEVVGTPLELIPVIGSATCYAIRIGGGAYVAQEDEAV